MELAEFRRRMLGYEGKVKARDVERMSLGSGVDDTPFYNKRLEEVLIDLMEKVEHLEREVKDFNTLFAMSEAKVED